MARAVTGAGAPALFDEVVTRFPNTAASRNAKLAKEQTEKAVATADAAGPDEIHGAPPVGRLEDEKGCSVS